MEGAICLEEHGGYWSGRTHRPAALPPLCLWRPAETADPRSQRTQSRRGKCCRRTGTPRAAGNTDMKKKTTENDICSFMSSCSRWPWSFINVGFYYGKKKKNQAICLVFLRQKINKKCFILYMSIIITEAHLFPAQTSRDQTGWSVSSYDGLQF